MDSLAMCRLLSFSLISKETKGCLWDPINIKSRYCKSSPILLLNWKSEQDKHEIKWDIQLNVRFCSIFACGEFNFFYFENWKHKLVGNPAFSFKSGEIWEALLIWSRETLEVLELFCHWMIMLQQCTTVHDDTVFFRHVLFNFNKIPILYLLSSCPKHSRPQH